MKVGLQTWGTAGDVRPLIALGGALRAAGHEVRIAITSIDGTDFEPLCRAVGIESEVVAPPALLAGVARRMDIHNPFRQLRKLLDETFFPRTREIYEAAQRLCATSDCVIGHFLLYPLIIAAQRAGVPHFGVIISPGMLPTVHHPPPSSFGLPNLGGRANAMLWRMVESAIDRLFAEDVNRLWRAEGLEPPRHVLSGSWISPELNLIAVSPLLVDAADDWRDRFRICGQFRIPAEAEPARVSDELAAFLSEGERPVFITLGSVRLRNAAEETALLFETAARTGRRAIMQTDAGAPGRHGDGVFVVRALHPSFVLPHCAAALHHGGAQTAMDTVRAGVPSVIVPYIEEQAIWAKTLHQRGLATRPIGWRRATPRRLAAALREALSDAALRERTAAAGERLRAENGGARAVDVIEERLRGRESPRSAPAH